jgi:hypothetical protein
LRVIGEGKAGTARLMRKRPDAARSITFTALALSPEQDIHRRNPTGRFTSSPADRLMSIRDVQSLSTNVRRIGWAALRRAGNCTLEKVTAAIFAISTPRRSHHRDPGLIQPRYIVSHEFEDFVGVGALGTCALDVDLAAKLLGELPPHPIGDKAALDPEDDVPEEGLGIFSSLSLEYQ